MRSALATSEVIMRKLLALALATAIAATACGSPGSSDSTASEVVSPNCAAPTSTDPASPSARKVSFAADVLPVLVTSCSFGACHGSPKGSNNGVFLGSKGGANDASAIRAGLVGRPSTQTPSLPYVTPSDPARSYLFSKLTADFCGLPECDGDRCGKRMPRGGDPLAPAALETVRAWIAQGAQE
jgi:hypothetical protein